MLVLESCIGLFLQLCHLFQASNLLVACIKGCCELVHLLLQDGAFGQTALGNKFT